MKAGRNDPCPCGSGKKYKRCCMAGDKAEQAERVAWERAARDMRTGLIGFAKEKDFVKDLAAGLGLFWQDRYAVDTVHMMSVDESLRFFDWFAHDYQLSHLAEGSPYAGKRLIEIYRQQVSNALSEKEATVLDEWIASPPGSAFVLAARDPEQGTADIRDLFLAERVLTVDDKSAAAHGEVGQILLARPLPEHDRVRLSGATAVLPASEVDGLRSFLDQAYADYGESQHGPVSYAQFLRDRAYLFTHYALQWAESEGRPAVSVEDPEAVRPGGQAVRRVVRWSQERVRT